MKSLTIQLIGAAIGGSSEGGVVLMAILGLSNR